MRLDKIKANPSNPRVIRDDKFNKLVKSLQGFPEMMYKRPIVVDETMTVLGGNMRLRALQHIYGKGGDIPDAWVVVAEGWTEEQKREFVIKDNAAFGEWDWDALANEWGTEDLADWGLDIPEDTTKILPAEAVEDDFDETKDTVETVCKKGDIWKLGNHRLMCGDSTDSGSVALLMEGEKADMCFTDPPYGVSYAEKNEYLNAISRGNHIQIPIENDHASPSEMFEFWKGVFGIIGEFTKECMAYYITSPQGGELLLLLLQAIQESETLALKHMLIWNKNEHVLGRCDYNYKHEPIIYGWKKKGTHHFVGGSDFKTSVWDIPKPLKSELHPTMKPVELVSACLLDNSVEGQSVLDLFGGSGTTMIAAEQLNRRCYMMELDPHYCDVIIARWEKFTGRKAERVTEGMDV